MPKMDNFLYENHWGSPSLTLLNVFNVINVLKMPKDPSLACWALFVRILSGLNRDEDEEEEEDEEKTRIGKERISCKGRRINIRVQ